MEGYVKLIVERYKKNNLKIMKLRKKKKVQKWKKIQDLIHIKDQLETLLKRIEKDAEKDINES